MAKAYSDDLRLRAINLMKKNTKVKVASLLGITIQTLCKWWKLYNEKGITTAIKPKFERYKKVDYNIIREYIDKYPDKTLKEIGRKFGYSAFGISKILRKLGFTYKKKILIRDLTSKFLSS